MNYLAFRLAGCFVPLEATGITALTDFAAFAGVAGLAAFNGFADTPGFVGGCLPALADWRLDRDDPDFTGIGMAA